MKTEIELLENALDTTSVNGKKLREYINKNYISNSVLDKIRAEIEQLRLHKAQFLTNDNKVCIDSQEVLNIIDKYKEESEE